MSQRFWNEFINKLGKMNRVFYLIPFLLLGCASNNCLEDNKIYSRFIELYKVDNNLVSKSSKEDILEYEREMNSIKIIFSKICSEVKGNKRMLFLDQYSVAWGKKRIGLVYLYEKDLLFSFSEENSTITIKSGYNDYEGLKKTLDILKPNFSKEAARLKEYFSKKSMADVPYLQLVYIDLSNPKDNDGIVGFNFGGIMSNEFDNRFIKNIKQQ